MRTILLENQFLWQILCDDSISVSNLLKPFNVYIVDVYS